MAGQAFGIFFIPDLNGFKTPSGSMTPCLIVMAVYSILNVILAIRMKESPLVKSED